MPLLISLPAKMKETVRWRLSFEATEEEDEKWEPMEEMLFPNGPRAGTLMLDVGSAFNRMVFELVDDFEVMRWTRKENDLCIALNRTALKALTELRGLTVEGAGDYYLEVLDSTRTPLVPVTSDVALHLDEA